VLLKARCNFFIREEEGEKVLHIDCSDCKNNSSISNEECFSFLYDLLKKEDISKVVFLREDFKKVLEKNEVRKLKDYIEAVDGIKPEQFCKDCKAIVRKIFGNFDNPSLVLRILEKVSRCEKCSKKAKNIIRILSSTFPGINSSELKERSLSRVKEKVLPIFFNYSVEIPERERKGEVICSYSLEGGKVNIIKRESRLIYNLIPEELTLSSEETRALRDLFKRKVNPNSISAFPINEKISRILKRHTSGYGLIETLLRDEGIQDIFINSSSNSRIFVNHSKFGFCSTNLIINEEEIERICTKLRMLSGRAFDAASPILDCFIPNFNTRVCAITKPLTLDGIGISMRKHKPLPWTLTQLIKNNTLSSYAAGLLSFLVDSQASILITGPRGSGKTSLLASLLAEIRPNERIVVIEDTPELPVSILRNKGFNVEHLKVKSPTSENNFEISPEVAVKTSLRLGEGILVIGEVRGIEAKALFEAMRIGAAGNCVLATIHGFSAYDTFDRVVNDLGVPRSSFKACDLVVCCALIKSNNKKFRKVVEITEVKKDWNNDPYIENGFLQLMKFNRKGFSLKFGKLSDSQILRKISLLRNMNMNEIFRAIKLRSEVKRLIVKYSSKRPSILSFDSTLKLNEIFYELEASLNFAELIKEFKKVLTLSVGSLHA